MKEKRDFSVRRLAVRRSERKKESPAPFEMTSEGEKQKNKAWRWAAVTEAKARW
jgi:hypothetical protein